MNNESKTFQNPKILKTIMKMFNKSSLYIVTYDINKLPTSNKYKIYPVAHSLGSSKKDLFLSYNLSLLMLSVEFPSAYMSKTHLI